MSEIIRTGMDTSKHFFQLHGVAATEQAALRRWRGGGRDDRD